MAGAPIYQPSYAASRALIIGIDRYQLVSPLYNARHDAEGMAEVLKAKFAFPPENVTLLLDDAATRTGIKKAFLSHAHDDSASPDDRLLVFFAGHGHTVPVKRGDIGYLIPFDGTPSDLSTLIRWSELTQDAELIPAKHILFLMDACFSGLALSRKPVPSGSMRFLQDMMQRYTRQVLTAGKADEVVADAGGTRKGHSIFTAHLLDVLEGITPLASGVLTANSVMAHVYQKVGQDPASKQTPHYGFIEGDGDFIFDTSLLATDDTEGAEKKPKDVLVKLPPISVPDEPSIQSVADILKELLSDPTKKIKLDDFVTSHIRALLERTTPENFPVQKPGLTLTVEEFASRLKRYEDISADLQVIVALLAYWGNDEQRKLLARVFARLAETDIPGNGLAVYIRLYWYPVFVLMHVAGIAALAAENYQSLAATLLTPVRANRHSRDESGKPIILPITDAMLDLTRSEMFKKLPDHERNYVPRSEYLHRRLQPLLEDTLFLGRSYESLFDQFEIFVVLVHIDQTYKEEDEHIWGPPGRFAWKFSSSRGETNPYTDFVSTALKAGDTWPPLRAGFFGGSIARFKKIAEEYAKILARINWW